MFIYLSLIVIGLYIYPNSWIHTHLYVMQHRPRIQMNSHHYRYLNRHPYIHTDILDHNQSMPESELELDCTNFLENLLHLIQQKNSYIHPLSDFPHTVLHTSVVIPDKSDKPMTAAGASVGVG